MSYVNRLLAFFRAGARTVGLSPKVLAPAITACVAAVVSRAGLTPGDIGRALGASSEVVVGAELVLGTKIAIWLLPAGRVVNPPRLEELGSDASQPEHVAERLTR